MVTGMKFNKQHKIKLKGTFPRKHSAQLNGILENRTKTATDIAFHRV